MMYAAVPEAILGDKTFHWKARMCCHLRSSFCDNATCTRWWSERSISNEPWRRWLASRYEKTWVRFMRNYLSHCIPSGVVFSSPIATHVSRYKSECRIKNIFSLILTFSADSIKKKISLFSLASALCKTKSCWINWLVESTLIYGTVSCILRVCDKKCKLQSFHRLRCPNQLCWN